MDRNSQVACLIENNPGIKFSEIMEKTGMKNGVLAYHIDKLEKSGVVKAERQPGTSRFYPADLTDSDIILIRNLRQETPRKILLSLLEFESLSFNVIVEKVRRSPSTVSFYLSKLATDKIVESKVVDSKRKYYVKDAQKLREAIHMYHPDSLDKSADRLADTFSSL